MKILIVALIIAALTLPAHAATDRELFQCSVGTGPCSEERPALRVYERSVPAIQEETEAEEIERAEIERLQGIVELLQVILQSLLHEKAQERGA